MIKVVSASNKSIENAGLTTDFRQAIAEYVWNGFDAKASKVNIQYEANELGNLSMFQIEDNGEGINRETIDATFGAFLASQKKQTYQDISEIRGKNGKGRFSFGIFASRAIWTTIYKHKSGTLRRYTITIDMSDRSKYELSDEEILTEDIATGTCISFVNVNITKEHLISKHLHEYLSTQFAWFLFLNKGKQYELQLNGIDLDYEYLIAKDESIVKKFDDYLFNVYYIRWDKNIGDKFYVYYLNQNDEERFKEPSSKNNNSASFYHSIYVSSPYFNNFEYVDQHVPRFDDIVDQTDEVFKNLSSWIKTYVADKYKEYAAADGANKLMTRMREKGWLPKFSSYEKQRESDLIDTIKQIFIIQPAIFNQLTDPQAKTLIGFLNLLLETEEKERIIEILDQIVSLTPDQREDLRQVLRKTSIPKITHLASTLYNRLKIIEKLKVLVFDNQKFTTERGQIQSIIEKNYWLFGENYTIVSRDEPFEKVLASYLRISKGKDQDASMDSEFKNRRMDIFLCQNHYLKGEGASDAYKENVIVELKRPSVKIGKEQYRQIEDYCLIIKKEPKFEASNIKWKYYVIGVEIEEDVRDQHKNFLGQAPNLVGKVGDNHEIYAITWNEIFTSFEIRMQYALNKLTFNKQQILREINSVDASAEGSKEMTAQILSEDVM